MSIPISIPDVVYGGIVPVAIAVMVAWGWRRVATAERWQPFGPTLAFVVGFHAGYWLLGLGPVRPESHWQWLPWVLLLTLPAGTPLFGPQSAIAARLGLTAVVAAVSAWLLVPTWKHLEPSRTVHLAVFGVAVVTITAATQPLVRRVPVTWWMINLAGIALATAAILGLSGNLRFAQIAGCGVAALAGIIVSTRFGKGSAHPAGLVLPFTLIVTGLMLIGRVNSFSEVPLVSYLLPPLAPLSLWLATNERVAGSGVRRWIVLCLPLVVCAVAVGFGIASEFGGEEQW